jgi:Rrf2 family protein
MLSHKSKYALKAAIALAREFGQGPVLISDIAQRERIPRKFLELILLELRNKGILQSPKGKGGGYFVAREPAHVRFYGWWRDLWPRFHASPKPRTCAAAIAATRTPVVSGWL